MNAAIYIVSFVSILALIVSFIAIARVAQWQKSVHGLDWEAIATLLGDVATVKRSITRLNGRLNGMDNAQPNFNWQDQVTNALSKPQVERVRGG
tara:strand:+ start:1173 stop:1454 length:282 start_codon:yes stop_codon:yes gene_type:complete